MTQSPHTRQPQSSTNPTTTLPTASSVLVPNDLSFLEKLLESMKEGMAQQIELRFNDLKNQIPTLVQSTIQQRQWGTPSFQPSRF